MSVVAKTSAEVMHIRQEVAADDAAVTATERPRRLDVLLVLGDEDLTPDEARVRHPGHQRHRDVDAGQAGAEHRDDGDDQDEEREGLDHVRDAHHQTVDASAVVAGQTAEDPADEEGEQDADQADLEIDAGPVQHARKDVASQIVRAEGVPRTRRLQPRGVIGIERTVRRNRGGEHGNEHDEGDHERPDDEVALPPADQPWPRPGARQGSQLAGGDVSG